MIVNLENEFWLFKIITTLKNQISELYMMVEQ